MYFSEQDSMYIEKLVVGGTKLNQAIAQMEVMRDESNFRRNLIEALSDQDVVKKLLEVMHNVN